MVLSNFIGSKPFLASSEFDEIIVDDHGANSCKEEDNCKEIGVS